MRAPRPSCRRSFGCAALAASLLWAAGCFANAQTLARPGWTGSGITTEPWWRSAVFYRIAPEQFQDSDGDGVGDLRGIAERLDYLQALGVDAVVLQLPFDDTGFDELFTEASRRHIRLVIGLNRSEPDRNGPDVPVNTPSGVPRWQDRLQGRARQWLSRGAAGILLPPVPGTATSAGEEDTLRRNLCHIVAAYPGERVVIASALATNGSQRIHLGAHALTTDEPQLIVRPVSLPDETGDPTTAIAAALTQQAPAEGAPLLEWNRTAAAGAGGSASETSPAGNGGPIAAALLTQHAAVLLEYGQELGDPDPRRMPWTPTNVTPPAELPAESEKPAAPSAPGPIVYGPYRPYVPPPPRPKAAAASVSSEPAPPDPDTLPGFSTELPPPNIPGVRPLSVGSVALQERDPRSLLNLYRRLLALHRGHATLRSGSLAIVQESDGAVVWLRRAPLNARTAASVVVAVNASDRPVTLSLSAEFTRLHLRAGELRSLLPGITGPEVMSSTRLTLPAHGIFLGELTHGR